MLRVALLLARNLVSLALWPIRALARALGKHHPVWVKVELRGSIHEVARPRPFWDPRPPRPSVERIRRDLQLVRADPSVEGVIFEIDSLRAGWATCEALRELFGALRESRKRTVAWLPGGAGTREYFVACGCDEVHAPPAASLFVLGLAREASYLKETLDRVGARVEVIAAGAYKSAAESLSRTDMSQADREQTEALLDAIYDRILRAIAGDRRMDLETARVRVDAGPMRPGEALSAGLIDGVHYDDELRRHLWGDRKVLVPTLARWARARRRAEPWRRLRPRPVIAVLDVSGLIVPRVGAAMPGRIAGADLFVKAARALYEHRQVCAVVVHVDSGGGSALASDEMHHAVCRLREKHPVCASFGDVAASGGYYVGVGCERIFARPTTITGSIGVITGKLDVSGTFAKLGVGHQILARGAHAAILSSAKSLTDGERSALTREVMQTYDLFLERVASGRGRQKEEIAPLAGGRVWSGSDALDRGLVDDMGGLPAAIVWARLRAGDRGREAVVRVIGAGPGAMPEPPPLPAAIARSLQVVSLLETDRVLAISDLDPEAPWG